MIILLVLCIVINAGIGVIFKYFDKHNINNLQAITVNYFTCVATALVVQGNGAFIRDFTSFTWLPIAIGLGMFFFLIFNLIALSMQRSGIIITSIFQKMSLIAPTIIAFIWYGDQLTWLKSIGLILALLSIIMLSYQPKNNASTGDNKLVFLFPLLVFIGSSLIDSSLLIVSKSNITNGNSLNFLAALFLFSGVAGGLTCLYKVFTDKAFVFQFKNIIAGILLGIPNFFSIYLILVLLDKGMQGSTLYPINNVGILIVSGIMGLLIFHEKLSKTKQMGFAVALLAIYCLS